MSRLLRNIRERLSQMEIGNILRYTPQSLSYCEDNKSMETACAEFGGHESREIAYAGIGGHDNNNKQLFVESKQQRIDGSDAIKTYFFDIENISHLLGNSLEGKYTKCVNISSGDSSLYAQLSRAFEIARINKIMDERMPLFAENVK